MGIVEKIKQLCASKKMTIAELERQLDLANSSIRKWDVQSPSSERLKKVADYFDVSADYLLGREQTASKNETDLAKMLDGVMSFDGEPMTDHDKEVIMAFLEGKFGKK